MNQEEIKQILPHRDNMLLVERAELTGENEAKGYYTIKGDEFFLKVTSRVTLLFPVLFFVK